MPLQVVKCHLSGPQLKLESWKLYPESVLNLSIAFSWVFYLLKIVDICFSKFIFLSISVLKSVTDCLDFASALFLYLWL